MAITREDPDAVGERSFVTIGLGATRELLVVIYTERGQELRLISARHASKRERKYYES